MGLVRFQWSWLLNIFVANLVIVAVAGLAMAGLDVEGACDYQAFSQE
jgi:hypothetical protein